LIHFILPFAWISIHKAKLIGHVLTSNGVLNNLNIDKNSKFDLGYKKLGHIWTSLDYLDCVHKNILTMIKQLGLPRFFVRFKSMLIIG
jgi:hypothetical protein